MLAHQNMPNRHARRAKLAIVLLAFGVPLAEASPFVFEEMPTNFDGLGNAWGPTHNAVAADFKGNGSPSWYAGGNVVAHHTVPSAPYPNRYVLAALPTVSLEVCGACTPYGMAFAVADVNRDGHPDIVRWMGWSGHDFYYTLQVYLANTDGSFSLGYRLDTNDSSHAALGGRRWQLIAADFDRDGDPDLAMLSSYENTDTSGSVWVDHGSLGIRWNNNASFATATTVQGSGFNEDAALVAGDFDQDGDIDLLATEQRIWSPDDLAPREDRIFLNNANTTFSAITTSGFPTPVGVADTNRDAWPDIVLANGTGVGRRENQGDASFGNTQYAEIWSTLPRIPLVATLADLNEDGQPDLVLANSDSNGHSDRLELRTGQQGSFAANPQVLLDLAQDIRQIGTGDANADGDIDLLVRQANGRYLLGRNTAQRLHPRAGALKLVASLSGVTQLAAGDIDHDGIADYMALQPSGNHLYLGLGADRVGGFAAAEFKILPASTERFTLADFNRDGRTDVAYVSSTSGNVRTATQSDVAYFFWPEETIGNLPGASLIVSGDGATRNGTTDLLVASGSTGSQRWFRNQNDTANWTTSDVTASLDPLPDSLSLVPYYAGFADAGFSCGDNGSLFAVNGYSNVLGWSNSANYTGNIDTTRKHVCIAANMDADEALEIALVDGFGRIAWWKPTNVAGSNIEIIDAMPAPEINAIAATDWDLDGLTDLLVASSTNVVLYTRVGELNTWTAHTLAYFGANDVVVVDSVTDGRPDAMIAMSNYVQLIPNDSSIVRVGSTLLEPGAQAIQPGDQKPIFALELSNPGIPGEDASIAVTSEGIRIYHAISDGMGYWTKGAAMTSSEAQQAIASASLLMDGKVIGTAGSGAVTAGGLLSIDYTPLGNVVPIAPLETKALEFRVRLSANALSASYDRFFVEHNSGEPGRVRVLDDGLPTGRLNTFGANATTPAKLVVITDPLSVPEVFLDGFE